jgi:group I intron endonuclease
LTLRTKKYKTPIYNSIRKYGLSNFSLEILEYCDNSFSILDREQYYIDKLSPEYNILKIAGSSYGFKHSAATLNLFKEREVSIETKNNLSVASMGRVLTTEVRKKISDVHKGKILSESIKKKISLAAINLRGVPVNVIDTRTARLSLESRVGQVSFVIALVPSQGSLQGPSLRGVLTMALD